MARRLVCVTYIVCVGVERSQIEAVSLMLLSLLAVQC